MMKKQKLKRKLENSAKNLKTQGENSKSRHFLNRWMPEKRSKRKPDLDRIPASIMYYKSRERLHTTLHRQRNSLTTPGKNQTCGRGSLLEAFCLKYDFLSFLRNWIFYCTSMSDVLCWIETSLYSTELKPRYYFENMLNQSFE